MAELITLRRLVNPTPEELDEVTAVAAAAFFGDQFTNCCVGGDWDLNVSMQGGTIRCQQVAGENWVACIDGKIVAFAGWFGPGREILDSLDQEEAGWNDFVAQMPPKLHDWWMNDFLPNYDDTTTTALGPGVKKSIWHLQLLATHPNYQGRGIATALVKHKEKEIASEGGKLMCLEAEDESNMELYKYWGWEVKETRHFTTPWGDFDLWSMSKAPDA